MILHFESITDRDNVALGLLHANYKIKAETVEINLLKNDYRLIIFEPIKMKVAEVSLELINLTNGDKTLFDKICMLIQACCDEPQIRS